MNTKWRSFGLFAYPDGCEQRFSEFRGGDRKLLEGLWYYDDEHRIDPNYDREVDAILKEHGKLPMQAAAASDPE